MKRMKLGMKMATGFGIMIAVVLGLGGLALWNIERMDETSGRLVNEFMPQIQISNNLERYSLLTMYAMRGFGLTGDKAYLAEGKKNLGEVEKYLKDGKDLGAKYPELVKLNAGMNEMQSGVDAYKQLVDRTAAENDAIAGDRGRMNDAAETFMKAAYEYLSSQTAKMQKEIQSGSEAGSLAVRLGKIGLINDIVDRGNWVRVANFKSQALRDTSYVGDAMKHFGEIDKKIEELKSKTSEEANLKQLATISESARLYRTAIDDALKNLKEVEDLAGSRQATADKVLEVARGNAVAGQEMTTKTITEMVSSISSILIAGLVVAVIIGIGTGILITISITRPLRRIIEGLGEGADQVAAASSQVASASQDLADGASQQASALEETSSAVEQMASTARQNAENAGQANTLMNDTMQVIDESLGAMRELSTSMEEVSRASEDTSKIIKTIDEIAFQTNLLALNAAVEAARAGEAGAGFAVVADEVRSLAMRAAEAARNTANLIEATVKKVKGSSEIVVKANQSFELVVAHSKRVGEIVAEITAASQEQSLGAEQVNRAVSEIDRVTQQNAAGAEESASASEEMNAQSAQMQVFVEQLIAMVGGTEGQSGGTAFSGGSGRNRKKNDVFDNESRSSDEFQANSGVRAAPRGKPFIRVVGANGKSNGKSTKNGRSSASAGANRGEVSPESVFPLDDDF